MWKKQSEHRPYTQDILGHFLFFFLIYICDAQRNLHKGNLWFFLLSNRVSNAMVQMKILRYLFAHENKYLRILDEIWYKAWTPSLHRQRSSSWLALFSHPLLSRREGLTGPRFTILFQIHQPLWTCFFGKTTSSHMTDAQTHRGETWPKQATAFSYSCSRYIDQVAVLSLM